MSAVSATTSSQKSQARFWKNPAPQSPSTRCHQSCIRCSPAWSASRALYQRSEEHTSELQSLMRISYAVFCLNKKKQQAKTKKHNHYQTHKYGERTQQITD